MLLIRMRHSTIYYSIIYTWCCNVSLRTGIASLCVLVYILPYPGRNTSSPIVICTWINVLILSNRFNYLFAHLGPWLLLWKPYSSDRRDLTILRIDFWHFGSKSRTVGRRKLVPNRPNKENFFEAPRSGWMEFTTTKHQFVEFGVG